MVTKEQPVDVSAAVLTVPEAAKLLRLGRNSVYEGIARGEIPSIRVGRRVMVPKAALERFLETAGPKPAA